jgi:hypothetical protein
MCSSPIVQVIKYRRMIYVEHVWGRVEVYTGCWWGNLRDGDRLEDPGIDRRIYMKRDLQEVGCEGTDWIDVAYDRDRWWALGNVEMNLWVP